MIYTASDVPFWSLPNALTPNADERGSIISKARTANGVGSAVPMAIFMIWASFFPTSIYRERSLKNKIYSYGACKFNYRQSSFRQCIF